MKKRGKGIRNVKEPKRDFFNRPEPQSRQRAIEANQDGDYKYKQTIKSKSSGKIKRGTKF
jgi:hypothetical protein